MDLSPRLDTPAAPAGRRSNRRWVPIVVIALVLGIALTFFYLWRRDLVANMIGHFLVDFISNVIPRLF